MGRRMACGVLAAANKTTGEGVMFGVRMLVYYLIAFGVLFVLLAWLRWLPAVQP